jgi:hypothetical protein
MIIILSAQAAGRKDQVHDQDHEQEEKKLLPLATSPSSA